MPCRRQGRPPSVGRVSEARPAFADAYTMGNSKLVLVVLHVLQEVHEELVLLVDDLADPGVGRSTLLMQRTTGMAAARALRRTKRVWGSGPSLASTSRTTPSTMESPRSTSPPKSACPGVSMMLIVIPSARPASRAALPAYRTAVFLARMVMPFSRSRSPLSIARSAMWSCSPRPPTARASCRPEWSCRGRRERRWRRCGDRHGGRQAVPSVSQTLRPSPNRCSAPRPPSEQSGRWVSLG